MIERPLFVVGTGRCGSTILHRILSHHADVVWLSPLCDRYPGRPELNRLAMRLVDVRLLSRWTRKLIYPGEWYRFWDYHCPGFSQPCRDLHRADVTPRTSETVRRALGQLLTQKRNRLLVKTTGWPRIGFLKEILPDAKFIHVYRDGRAVANSLIHVRWWSGWQGPTNWRWGEMTPKQERKWMEHDRSFLVLAAIEWEILMSAYGEARHEIPADDLLEIRYEDLCQDPVTTFKRATAFAALEWSSAFEEAVRRYHLRNANDQWQRQLSPGQQKALSDCLRDALQQYGYR